ncbi:unnamed protein product [Kluyveromyces dobzhanskii CBS 2104]|uniref:WGS project CCBQ000000000 data, contig 00102 n=1 Tax=Kluyveromyces dobzhanskii CBS 2104 TaxID=1427455 RepID=A0A0A8L620_9SACH|nr:unnamed protein product [Kluyveromyces dobzhanskii CBS 2104]
MPFTLRHHTCSVTGLLYWHDPLKVPSLISGDEDGLILVWDLLSRKPYCRYKCKGQIASLQQLNSLLIATCKDHTLRIFNFPSAVVSTNRDVNAFPELNLVYEIPVNTLNFANTALEKVGTNLYRLWCCNTQDSETIDIYEFDLRDSKSLKRIHRAVSLYELISTLVNPSIMKFDKLGTVMKFIAYCGVIYVGFESGFVIGLYLKSELHIAYISSGHYPEPVLDFAAGENLGKVISSSTDSYLGLHSSNVGMISKENFTSDDIIIDDSVIHTERMNIPVAKVSHIQQIDNILVTSSWSGKTELFDLGGENVLAVILKERGQVHVDDNPYGNASLSKNSTKVKICSMVCLPKNDTVIPSCTSEGAARRWIKFCKEAWCLIGYEDGSILAREITFTGA